jgi:hypothetical protein
VPQVQKYEVEGNFPELTLEVGRRLHLDNDIIVVEWTCNYGDGRLYRNVSIAEVHDGKATKVTDYWGAPWHHYSTWLLVTTEFPGNRQQRGVAYLGMAHNMSRLITIGTVFAPIAWLAVTFMFFLGVAVTLAGVASATMSAARGGLISKELRRHGWDRLPTGNCQVGLSQKTTQNRCLILTQCETFKTMGTWQRHPLPLRPALSLAMCESAPDTNRLTSKSTRLPLWESTVTASTATSSREPQRASSAQDWPRCWTTPVR